MSKIDPATIVAGARVDADPAYRGVSPPLWTSDSYAWDDADTKPAYDYARTVNPNRDLLVDALARLEGAAGGVVTGSGQSAALLALLLLPADALVVAPHDCYGGTYRLLKGLQAQGRIRCHFADLTDAEGVDDALRLGPKMVWIESPSNPLMRLTDIAAVAARAKAIGALTIADNTLPTPCRQQPLALGCDLVLHSTTKAINGHGDVTGGALLAHDPALIEQLQWWANAAGLSASPQSAWQTLRGLRTLPVRVAAQEQSAQAIAAWLIAQPGVSAVHFPGLARHPQHELAGRQQSGPGFMLSFALTGGAQAADLFAGALQLITLASSLGGYASLICRPASMTHKGMPPEAQAVAGLEPGLLRLSIGLEGTADLIADLERGLAAL